VVDAYALTLAALVLTAGSLADRFGRRRLFAVGLAIFTVASLLCALAPDPTFLNLARALQGVGGAVLFAVSLALIAQEFPGGRERGMAMGVYGATIGVAVAISPLVGGALVDGLGWESIFYLNVPI
jgi:MFS family permease